MSIAALPRGVVGGEKAGVEGRIGCNAAVVAHGVAANDSGKSSSSSLGKDSDCTSALGSGSHCQEESDEVQSSYKGPLCALDALEESLPFRRGISKFYNGKSKSFTNLRASLPASGSCQDLAKPDNPYAKKRKNAIAFSLMYQQTCQKPTSSGESLHTNFDSESNGDVGESKRQKQSDEPKALLQRGGTEGRTGEEKEGEENR